MSFIYGVLHTLFLVLLMFLTGGFFVLCEKTTHWLDKKPVWVRWLLVLPGSVIFGILITCPFHWAIIFISERDSDDRWFSPQTGRTIEYYGCFLVIPLALVYAGARIAPRFRVCVSALLSGAVVAPIAWLYYHALAVDGFEISEPKKFYMTSALLVAGLASAVYATVKW
jgi:hypothetical protein